ncbi:hypothetical protein [Bergeyella sp. RCAD1439]|uniref:hypothetical protein n=1 Tax=Bergeyella anatis TaxID=3113737 RepID=UPI002E16F62A|nr:hypothetical protein [Bergeyella sp. RCAD1439]
MKKIVFMLAFLSFGAWATAQEMPTSGKVEGSRKERNATDAKRHLEEMKKELNLTPAQVAQFEAAHEKYRSHREEERARNKQVRQQMDQEIRRILTPEQYTRWEARHSKKDGKKRGGHGGRR